MQTFYNTVNLTGDDLRNAVTNAINQETAIFLIYKNTRKPFTASDITRLTEKAGKRYPIHSNRRGITNLMKRGELVKLSETKIGEYGVKEHFYQLNFFRYPAITGTQSELFKTA